MTTILFLLDLRRNLYTTAFSLIDSDHTVCGGNISTPGCCCCCCSDSKQDASQAWGALRCVNTVSKVNLNSSAMCSMSSNQQQLPSGGSPHFDWHLLHNRVYEMWWQVWRKIKPKINRSKEAGTLPTSPVLQFMLIVLVPSVFVYLRIFVSCFKKVLICPQRLWTARKRRLSFFLCSSDLLGIQCSDTSQRLAFFPSDMLMHARTSALAYAHRKKGIFFFLTYSKGKINAD